MKNVFFFMFFVLVLVTSNEVTTPNCNCGISKELKNDGNRIVGGRSTNIEDFPWQISITDKTSTILEQDLRSWC